MRKVLSLVLLLALLLSLTACSFPFGSRNSTEPKVFSRDGFSITLPGNSLDLSFSKDPTEDPYLIMAGDIAIAAKILNSGDTDSMSLEEYTKKIIEVNGYDSVPEERDGLWTFTFEEEGGTFLAVILKTETCFWLVTATCDIEDYSELQDTMWQYLTTVQVSDY